MKLANIHLFYVPIQNEIEICYFLLEFLLMRESAGRRWFMQGVVCSPDLEYSQQSSLLTHISSQKMRI